MQKAIELAGVSSAVLGVAVCLVAGLVRLSGSFSLMSISAGLAFECGVALMVFSCLVKLHCPNSQS